VITLTVGIVSLTTGVGLRPYSNRQRRLTTTVPGAGTTDDLRVNYPGITTTVNYIPILRETLLISDEQENTNKSQKHGSKMS